MFNKFSNFNFTHKMENSIYDRSKDLGCQKVSRRYKIEQSKDSKFEQTARKTNP